LTDSDDIAAYQQQGLPLAALPVTDETLFIPNTVGVIKGAPNPRSAQKLFEFLQRPEIATRLVAAKALESSVAPELQSAQLQVRWDELLRDLEIVTEELKGIFLR
jgi:ABC-type Fe3+ transport system substrate-binding protein